jgi:ribosomal protein L11 methyltransferase
LAIDKDSGRLSILLDGVCNHQLEVATGKWWRLFSDSREQTPEIENPRLGCGTGRRGADEVGLDPQRPAVRRYEPEKSLAAAFAPHGGALGTQLRAERGQADAANDAQHGGVLVMATRSWLALTARLDASDRPRLDALLSDWEMLGLVEADTSAGEKEEITAHFSTEQMTAATLQSLCREALASPPFRHSVEWRVESLADQDWMAGAREFFSGISVSESLHILPAWAPEEKAAALAGRIIRIDPGMAFGTGSHESTRLMLQWLEALCRPGMSVLDLGAGSGILSIAAALLGARPIVAIERDPDAEENARRNIALNGVSDEVEYLVTDFSEVPVEAAQLVLCNTLVEEFEPWLERFRDLTRPGGQLVLSGFLEADEAALLSGLRAIGLEEVAFRREAEWSSACVQRR